ncbi:MAG: SurA N-terminal domain-containing protein [Legionellales bacterium]|nr:SurA N-terminal domain-containing protein [Legionellales bacterium]
MKRISNVFIFFLSMMSAIMVYAKPQPLDSIIAYVNHDVITDVQLNQQVQIIRSQLQESHSPVPSEKKLRQQVLDHMIDQLLQKQSAEKAGIKVTDNDVNQAIKRIAASNHMSIDQLRAYIIKSGISYDSYKKTLRDQILVSKVQQAAVGSSVVLNKKEVDHFLKTLPHDPANQLYQVQDLLIPVADNASSLQWQTAKTQAETLLQSAKNQGDLKKLAAQHSLNVTDLGLRALADLPTVFASTVQAMKKNQIAGPIKTANGFHLIKLIKITAKPGSNNAITPQQAENMLYARKMGEAVDKWVKKLRETSYIHIVNN